MEPKISTVEIIFLLFATLIADLLSVVPIFNWVVSAVMFPTMQFYLKMKGVSGAYALVGNVIELIPVLSILPAYTAAILMTIYIDRHPTSLVAKTVEKVTKVVPAKTATQVK